MAFLKVTLLVFFFCLVNAIPQVKRFDKDNTWTQTATITSQTIILDGSQQQVGFINMTVAMYNYTSESSQLVLDTVRRNLANIKVDLEAPPASLRVYEAESDKLPLTLCMTVKEVVTIGPNPSRTVGMALSLDVYAKKKHRSDVLGALQLLSV